MNEHKLKKKSKSRILAAALIVAGTLLLAAFLYTFAAESVAMIWLTTAVYMLGPMLAALIVWPQVKYDGSLFMTAVLLAVAIVVPWAFIKPSAWVSTFLPQLGQWANVLFFVLLTTHVSTERPSRSISWAITGFYLLIMLGLPLLL